MRLKKGNLLTRKLFPFYEEKNNLLYLSVFNLTNSLLEISRMQDY